MVFFWVTVALGGFGLLLWWCGLDFADVFWFLTCGFCMILWFKFVFCIRLACDWHAVVDGVSLSLAWLLCGLVVLIVLFWVMIGLWV